MVRQLIADPTAGWKAAVAVLIVAGGLLWHILACTESAMMFSPDGQQLAFVVMEPYAVDKDLKAEPAKNVWRLLVLGADKKVRVLEENTAAILTAPAYSPDGKTLAYLRVPLLTDKTIERLKELAKADDAKPPAAPPKLPDDLVQALTAQVRPGEPAAQRLAESVNLNHMRPPGDDADKVKEMLAAPALTCLLVVRDARTDAVLSNTLVPFPASGEDNGGPMLAYLLARPRYSADGQWVYASLFNMLKAINPATRQERILGVPVALERLSPDGKVLAAVSEKRIDFLQPADGKVLGSYGAPEGLSLGGVAWAGPTTLAALTQAKGKDQHPRLEFVDTAAPGKGVATKELTAIPGREGDNETNQGELAIAPDGQHLVIAYDDEVFFLDAKGTVLQRWAVDKELLCQPVFTPDGKQVAFKHLTGAGPETMRTDGIAFFTPEGTQAGRVEIPATTVKLPGRPGGF